MSLLSVQEGGPLTTIQDAGRFGHLRVGIPTSGPMDREAFLLANRLVGNPDDAAVLECTLVGPRLELTDARLIAVTGADMSPTVNGAAIPMWEAVPLKAGDVLRLGPARAGVRAYVAVAGGLDTPRVLGSRSTYVRGRLGGLGGRALRKGDRLPLGAPAPARPRRLRAGRAPAYGTEAEVAVTLGPQDDRFTAAGIAALLEGPYELLPQSDRMGARLKGPFIEHTVLLADRQSAGGYTQIATVCSFDLGRIAQLKPGGRLAFRRVTVAEAHAMLRDSVRALDTAIE